MHNRQQHVLSFRAHFILHSRICETVGVGKIFAHYRLALGNHTFLKRSQARPLIGRIYSSSLWSCPPFQFCNMKFGLLQPSVLNANLVRVAGWSPACWIPDSESWLSKLSWMVAAHLDHLWFKQDQLKGLITGWQYFYEAKMTRWTPSSHNLPIMQIILIPQNSLDSLTRERFLPR